MSRFDAYPRGGHRLQLLQGSGDFFPALVEAFDTAQREIRLETYIFDFEGRSAEVASALERAALRGVSVKVVVDGFGSAPLPATWESRFLRASVDWRVYSPMGWLGVIWLRSWRRLHRKLCVVDGELAFCGGINILDDYHDPNHGALASPRLDFAVRVTGPLVFEVESTMKHLWLRMQAMLDIRKARLSGALDSLRASGVGFGKARAKAAVPKQPLSRAALVLRDNLRNRTRIERAYRRAIGRAHSEIIIANAYFVPGRKMRQALVSAARRGVRVRLLLQGRYEYFMQYYAARPIYSALLKAGVEIYEYSPSFLHAKVAVIDRRWATVGSSNLDPLSLLLAREANVVVDDQVFAEQLRDRLMQAILLEGRAMDPAEFQNRPWRQRIMEGIALGAMRLALAVQGKKYL
jgi:cardiolipin synthase A/B